MNSAQQLIDVISTPLGERRIARLDSVPGSDSLPYSIKVLLESALRNLGRPGFSRQDVNTIAAYDPGRATAEEIPFLPGRVILQDFTGVPAVVDPGRHERRHSGHDRRPRCGRQGESPGAGGPGDRPQRPD